MKKALAAALILLSMTSLCGAEVITSDKNNDGKVDLWFTMEGESLVEYSADRNYDGMMDQKVLFDAERLRGIQLTVQVAVNQRFVFPVHHGPAGPVNPYLRQSSRQAILAAQT